MEKDESNWDQFGPRYDHPPFDGTPRTYLIASTPRSGSHYLGHLLFETGALGSPLEYFHPQHFVKWQKKFEARTVENVLHGLFRCRTSPSGWFGVKAHWPQFVRFAESDDRPNIVNFDKYIQISRRDQIEQAISLVLARQTKAWISFNNAQSEPKYDFNAIRDAVAEINTETSRWNEYFNAHGIQPIAVSYETLLDDPANIVKMICSLFGVKNTEISRKSQRMPQSQSSHLNREWRQRFTCELASTEMPS